MKLSDLPPELIDLVLLKTDAVTFWTCQQISELFHVTSTKEFDRRILKWEKLQYYGCETNIFTATTENSAFGHKAGVNLREGYHNLCLGYKSGENLTNGSGNVMIDADCSDPDEFGIIRIGTKQVRCYIKGIYNTKLQSNEVKNVKVRPVFINSNGRLFTRQESDINTKSEIAELKKTVHDLQSQITDLKKHFRKRSTDY